MQLNHHEYIRFPFEGRMCALLISKAGDESNDPRSWHNLGTMACFHSRYHLGDLIPERTPEEFWQSLVRDNLPAETINRAALEGKIPSIRVEKNPDDPEYVDIYEYYALRTIIGTSEPSEVLEYEAIRADCIHDYILDDLEPWQCKKLLEPVMTWLPLFLYDHSGLTMSTGSFHDPWDSGQVGWICLTKEKFLAETGYKEADWPQKATEMLQNEVKTYDQYLTGEVYNFTLFENTGTDDEPEWEETDSCGGFFGDDIEENGIVDSVPGLADAIASGDYETGTASEHRVTVTTYDFD